MGAAPRDRNLARRVSLELRCCVVAQTSPLEDREIEVDAALVARAQAGDRGALGELCARHHRYLFNVAVRMVHSPAEAEDVAQAVWLRVVRGLAGFRGEAAFRTWLYRIVRNEVFDRKKRSSLEARDIGFDGVREDLEGTADSASPEDALLVEEAKVGCTLAMLMCLDRRQRLVFTLGECLGVTDRVGAEILEVTPEGFRQLLARARRDVYRFMNEQCGLVNAANPCRCAKKTRGFIERGWVDPERLVFAGEHLVALRRLAPSRTRELDDLDRRHAEVFRDHPFLAPADEAKVVQRILAEADVVGL